MPIVAKMPTATPLQREAKARQLVKVTRPIIWLGRFFVFLHLMGPDDLADLVNRWTDEVEAVLEPDRAKNREKMEAKSLFSHEEDYEDCDA
jgi:hypothetical protein